MKSDENEVWAAQLDQGRRAAIDAFSFIGALGFALKTQRFDSGTDAHTHGWGLVYARSIERRRLRLSVDEVRSGYLEESAEIAELSRMYGLPSVNLEEFDIAPEVIALVGDELARRLELIPIRFGEGRVVVAMVDPSNIFAIDQVRRTTGLSVQVVICSRAGLRRALAKSAENGPA